MDPAGWVAIDEVLRVVGIDRAGLAQLVRDNAKQRLQIEGDLIRACQGHGTDNPFVRVEALEKSWRPFEGDERFFHGTRVDLVPAIARDGLKPMARTHVHCAASEDSPVGKRASVDLLLVIEPTVIRRDELGIFVAPNGVILVRRVPARAIVDVLPRSSAATVRIEALRAMVSAVGPAMLSRSR